MLQAQRRWYERQAPDDIVAELEHELCVSPLTARLLALRGVGDADQGLRFLRKQMKDLIPPQRMRGMDIAAKRLATAINQQERILIHGDYDVDGSTACSLLKLFCQACAHDAIGWIPDRRIDGYGLGEASLQAAKDHQAQLMITVDCGIADGGWAKRIERETGCDVIITDHHLPQAQLPECLAVCNPNHPDCPYPDKGLAGVGVAWKLAWATACELSGGDRVTDRLRGFLLDALALVAIGTVADCAPLDNENRILVHHGLQALSRTTNHGLRALLVECKLDDAPIQGDDIGWKIGPLLNASGRIGSAIRNVRLLCSTSAAEANQILDEIRNDNDERRRLTQLLTDEIIGEVESNPAYADRQTLVFAGDGWHQGILGIVASRLVDRYQKPAAVIGINDGVGKGSLRTIADVSLGDAIDACREHLIGGGGHAMAAGLSITPEKVPDFIAAFEEHVKQRFPGGLPLPGTVYDATACIAELGDGFFDEFASLAPFGTGNPAPVLKLSDIRFVSAPKPFGRDGAHLRGALTDNGGGMQPLIAWKVKEQMTTLCRAGMRFDMLLRPELNCWRGRVEPRLQFIDGTSR